MKTKLLVWILSSIVIISTSAPALNADARLEARLQAERGANMILEKKYDAAVEACDKALLLDPSRATFYALRGVAYAELGKLQKALEDINQAIALDPKDGDFYTVRATANQQLGNHTESLNDLIAGAKLGDDVAQEKLKNLGIAWDKD